MELLREAGSLKIKDHDNFVFGQNGEHGEAPGEKFDIKKLQRNMLELFEPLCRTTKNTDIGNGDAQAIDDDDEQIHSEKTTTENEWSNDVNESTWQL